MEQTHPFLAGLALGIWLMLCANLVWRDILKPFIAERRRQSWEKFRSSINWPPPPIREIDERVRKCQADTKC